MKTGGPALTMASSCIKGWVVKEVVHSDEKINTKAFLLQYIRTYTHTYIFTAI